MNKELRITIIGTVILVTLIVMAFIQYNNTTIKKENELLSKAIQAGAVLVDVRTPEEYQEGSVRGAINIPLDSIKNHFDEFKQHSQIILFCRTGNRSGTAKRILETEGFRNILNGGPWDRVQKVLNRTPN
jgi:phage shock protein E